MYSTGMNSLSKIYYNGSTVIIGIPTGIKIYSWIISLQYKSVENTISILYTIGFIFLFVLGGITGIICSSSIIDISIHDTYFIIAHFHYVLSMGFLFSLIGGVLMWLNTILGLSFSNEFKKRYNKIDKIQFYLLTIGVNILFYPMHLTGLGGLPRRYKDYNINYSNWNRISSIGSIISLIGIFLLIIILIERIKRCSNFNIYRYIIKESKRLLYFYNNNTLRYECNIIKNLTLDNLHISYYYHHYREIPIVYT